MTTTPDTSTLSRDQRARYEEAQVQADEARRAVMVRRTRLVRFPGPRTMRAHITGPLIPGSAVRVPYADQLDDSMTRGVRYQGLGLNHPLTCQKADP